MSDSIRELKMKIDSLKNSWRKHPEIIKLREKILEENRLTIEGYEKEITMLQSRKKSKKPRFPENTPQHVLDVCNEYWEGTTEFDVFRIHIWNDKAVWTSYPSGGYSNNWGYNPTPACFHLISLNKSMASLGRMRAEEIFSVTGRNSEKKLRELLEEHTK